MSSQSSSEDKKRHYKIMWLEPQKDYGKLSFIRRHRIITKRGRRERGGNEEGVSSPFKEGQNVRVRWGKNSAYRARIESVPTGDSRTRIQSEESRSSLGSSTLEPTTRKRRASEGSSMCSSQHSEEQLHKTPLESMISNCINDLDRISKGHHHHDVLSGKSGIVRAVENTMHNKDVAWTKPSMPAPKRSKSLGGRSPKKSKSLGGLFTVPSFTDALDVEEVPDRSTTLQDHERRRHADLRLRLLKDAEHKLDTCFGMVRSLYSHLSIVEERRHLLPMRRFPAMTSEKSSDLNIDKRQHAFEQRALVFYEMVKDIQELMADSEFKKWVSEAVTNIKQNR